MLHFALQGRDKPTYSTHSKTNFMMVFIDGKMQLLEIKRNISHGRMQ